MERDAALVALQRHYDLPDWMPRVGQWFNAMPPQPAAVLVRCRRRRIQ